MEPGANKSEQEKSEEGEEEGEISHFPSSRYSPPPAAISSHSPLPKRLEQAYIPVYDD